VICHHMTYVCTEKCWCCMIYMNYMLKWFYDLFLNENLRLNYWFEMKVGIQGSSIQINCVYLTVWLLGYYDFTTFK
jgi:hypothetical protein